jgi:hypothetical protein
MYNTYVRSILGRHAHTLMHEADKGGGAGGEGGTGDDKDKSGAGGNGDDQNSLDDLLKDPVLKKAYEDKLKEQLGKRLKKFEGVDADEYKRLKEAEDKKKEDELSDVQKAQKKLDEYKAKESILESKERDIAVKEFAIDNGLDSKLISRLIDKSTIKRAEGGEGFEGIEEAIEAVKTEFPQLFQSASDDNTQGQGGTKGGTFKVPNQKGNPDHKPNTYDAGKARALARHQKQQQ